MVVEAANSAGSDKTAVVFDLREGGAEGGESVQVKQLLLNGVYIPFFHATKLLVHGFLLFFHGVALNNFTPSQSLPARHLHRIAVFFAQVETAGTEDDGGEDSLGRALTIAVAVSGALVMQLFNFFYDFLRFFASVAMATDNRICHYKLPLFSYAAGRPCLAGFCGLSHLQRRLVLLRRRLRDPQRGIQAGGGGGFGRGGLCRGGDVARQAARVKPAAFLTSSIQLTIFFFVGTIRRHYTYVFILSCLEKTVTFC